MVELRIECEKVGINKKGLKTDLITRLHEFYNSHGGEGRNKVPKVDYSSMKVVQLRKECKKYGIDCTKMRKAEMIKVLEERCN